MFKQFRRSFCGLLLFSLNIAGNAYGGITSAEGGDGQNVPPQRNGTAEEQIERFNPAASELRTRGLSPESKAIEVKAFLVDGYRNADYVYGEMTQRAGQDVEGYIYHANGRKTYIYGERMEKQIQAYDRKGNLFTLRVLD